MAWGVPTARLLHRAICRRVISFFFFTEQSIQYSREQMTELICQNGQIFFSYERKPAQFLESFHLGDFNMVY